MELLPSDPVKQDYLIGILKQYACDPIWRSAAEQALEIMEGVGVENQNSSTHLQSSKAVGDMHANRKRGDFYKQPGPLGLDETIVALCTEDVEVRLSYVETDRGTVAFWLSECPVVLRGLLVLKANPPKPETNDGH